MSATSSGWKKGKVLWFDDLAGEGMVLDEAGNNLYFHHTAIKNEKQKMKLAEDALVKFTIYENGYLRQIDQLKEAK